MFEKEKIVKNVKNINKDTFGFYTPEHYVVGSNALKISDSEYSDDCKVIDIRGHISKNNVEVLELKTNSAPHKNSKIQLLGLFAICSTVLGFFVGYMTEPNQYEVTQYQVQSGDTLWEVASSSNYSNDISETIHEIKDINNLQNEVLKPGQTLLVPTN